LVVSLNVHITVQAVFKARHDMVILYSICETLFFIIIILSRMKTSLRLNKLTQVYFTNSFN